MECTHKLTVKGIGVVPCGRCISCRVNRAQEWTMRLEVEGKKYYKKAFVTLTYDDLFLETNSLSKKHLQDFINELKKNVSDIVYYAVGEYGEEKGRPHYHGIFFGISPKDHVLVEKIWKKGFSSCGSVTTMSINYVTAYIMKKLYGDIAKEVYIKAGIIPPFALMSKKIGYDWLMENKERYLRDLSITRGGRQVRLPRYFIKKLKEEGLLDDERLNEYKMSRIADKVLDRMTLGIKREDEGSYESDRLKQIEADYKSKHCVSNRKL